MREAVKTTLSRKRQRRVLRAAAVCTPILVHALFILLLCDVGLSKPGSPEALVPANWGLLGAIVAFVLIWCVTGALFWSLSSLCLLALTQVLFRREPRKSDRLWGHKFLPDECEAMSHDAFRTCAWASLPLSALVLLAAFFDVISLR